MYHRIATAAAVALALCLPIGPALPAQQRTAPTGRALAGVPALNFDADEGVGYGALLQYYDYGSDGADPYRFTLQPTLFGTTRGRRDLVLFVDAPHLLPGGWRAGGAIGRELELATPYYGIGNDTRVDAGATTGANPYFYRYGRTVLRAGVDVQHSVGHPSLRVLLGVGARHVVVRPVPYDEGTTLLAQTLGTAEQPALASRSARVGLVWDSRDREIGPRRGTWAELLVQGVSRPGDAYGSYTRVTSTVRRYVPLGARMTLAQRVVVQNVSGNAPVTELSLVQGSYKDDEALGGASSLRGIPKDRYLGKGIAFANTELRWDAASFTLRGTPSRLVLSGFVDGGRVWSDGVRLGEVVEDLHVGAGAGARVAVGPSFVLASDVGHSAQSAAAVYIGVGYLF